MEKAIYKYENKINHKIYIGQTNNPERRYQEHLYGQSYQTSLIEKAIHKYGINNFTFEILEWTPDYDTREQYWIEYYRSYKPYGYNICEGGGYLPNQQKENHSQCQITEETARNIQADLLDNKLSYNQIVEKYKTTFTIVNNINTGHTWNYYNLSYPLRSERARNEERALKVINLLKNTQKSMKEIAQEVGWGESQISMINRGSNHHQENIQYPIRKKPRDNSALVPDCVKMLQEGKSNGEISELLGVSCKWVSSVNVGKAYHNDTLNYPIRKR